LELTLPGAFGPPPASCSLKETDDPLLAFASQREPCSAAGDGMLRMFGGARTGVRAGAGQRKVSNANFELFEIGACFFKTFNRFGGGND
jgi:hypothetical protein